MDSSSVVKRIRHDVESSGVKRIKHDVEGSIFVDKEVSVINVILFIYQKHFYCFSILNK